ncbi:RNA polymerase sigma factor [Haliangium ochraceum]|uniref:RNA polymerase, sigma-24 subunit, ECF subfamily n=1 Tax=Haliangium ochraceum (strain DSM 14365 / JCM 11303 / SMP-2) TaxID=502025 RepID=D0LHR3_HALO1|nr:sigma-70 family RNA polymerase sigma factor [Haliangium ochraceum]ACY12925.1 RNA polymerase, sigma-24 subunit, ECF subfamily [Haliangium ochraceum DSM 14365]
MRHKKDQSDQPPPKPSLVQDDVLTPALGDSERNYVYSVAMKYVKDEEAAADVAQDALLLAHRHRGSFRGDSRYSTWLYRIAATTALMYLRKKRRRSREILSPLRVEEDSVLAQHPRSPESGPDDAVASQEAMEIIRQRLGELGDKYERIFWLRYLEGYTETEIAALLDLTLATVKTRAHRARVAVRETLRAAA